MIDEDGYRLNVGIILANSQGLLFWGKRIGMDAWQFPQGGIHSNEEPLSAMYRELYEEIGLHEQDVEVLAQSARFYTYHLPKRFRRHTEPLCIGQKQKWFLLRLLSCDDHINLNKSKKPEFEVWRWVKPQTAIDQVILFKREVYKAALKELGPYLSQDGGG